MYQIFDRFLNNIRANIVESFSTTRNPNLNMMSKFMASEHFAGHVKKGSNRYWDLKLMSNSMTFHSGKPRIVTNATRVEITFRPCHDSASTSAATRMRDLLFVTNADVLTNTIVTLRYTPVWQRFHPN